MLRPPLGPACAREHACAHPAMKARRQPAVKNAFRHARARDDERPFWGLRHRPQRAPMAWPNRRCAHCHLPPRALPDAQPQQHGAQCAEQHDKQLGAPPTFLITKHQSCAPRGRVRRTNTSRFAHAFPDCESPRAIPHAPPFAPLIAHQLVQLVAQHLACDVHESPHAAQGSEFRRRMESVAAALEPPLQVPCAAATCVPSASVNKAVAYVHSFLTSTRVSYMT